MSVTEEIRAILQAEFQPDVLIVEDESESHRGHAGFQEGGESHFKLTISATAFDDMSRVQRHRSIHAALGPVIINRIHALAMKIDGSAK